MHVYDIIIILATLALYFISPVALCVGLGAYLSLRLWVAIGEYLSNGTVREATQCKWGGE